MSTKTISLQPISSGGPSQPTIQDFHRANVAVLADSLPKKLDALFLHGSCIRDPRVDDIILDQAAELFFEGKTNVLVINGIGDMPGAYPGVDVWREGLIERGLYPYQVLSIPPSDKTAIESANFLNMASEYGWEKIAISSSPHHQLRCFLQLVAVMQRSGDWSQVVYNRPTRGIPWDWTFTKPSINPKVEPVTGNLEVHSELEVRNVLRYAVPAEDRDGITEFTPHATIEEMFRYLRWRDEWIAAKR